ncbi:MAG: ATP-binding protein [Candidatus Nanohaloarchaea archaeon]
MSGQIPILEWWYENHEEEKYGLKEAYQKYCEEEGYEGDKETFGNLLRKLKDKGLLEKPSRGVYRLSENGKTKACYIQNQELNELPESNDEYQDVVEKLVYFLEDRKEQGIKKAYSGLHNLKIRISEIEKYGPEGIELADYFEENPKSFIEALEEAIDTISEFEDKLEYDFKIDVDYYETEIYKARDAENLGEIVTLEGTINYASEFSPETISAVFECVQCGDRYKKEQQDEKLKSPYKCDCGSRKFELEDKETVNRINLKLSGQKGFNEEIQATRTEGTLTKRLVDAFKPGKSLRITGVVKEKQPNKKEITPYVEILDFEDEVTDYVETIDEEDRDEVRRKVEDLDNPFSAFASSLAPDIVCQEQMKQVVAASLIGAETGKKQDGRIHSFIVSNPGVAKSDLMSFVKETFPDTYLSDGKNTTQAGLIGTPEQEDGVWVYKAGKIVQADEGTLLLDEFDKLPEEHATALNRPMSNGTVEIDKGSENLEDLPAYASIIAAGNFTEELDEFSQVKPHLPDHAASLMDRWDLLLALREKSDEEKQKINKTILDKHTETGVDREPEFTGKELLIYRELAKETEAYLTDEAKKTILKWLEGNLSIAEIKGNKAFQKESRRHLDTLPKLTKMFAKSELRKETTMEDAERAVQLLSMCKESLGLTDGETYEDVKPEEKVKA